MVLFEASLCGLKVKRGVLFGLYQDKKITTIHGLFFKATVFHKGAMGVLATTMRGICEDSEWLSMHHPSVIKARDEAVRYERERYGDLLEKDVSETKEEIDRVREENLELSNENRTLRKAIEIVGSEYET